MAHSLIGFGACNSGGVSEFFATSGTVNAVTSPLVNDQAYSLEIQAGSTQGYAVTPRAADRAQNNTISHIFHVRFADVTLSATERFIAFHAGNNPAASVSFGVELTSGGVVQLYSDVHTTPGVQCSITPSPALAINTWYKIRVDVLLDTSAGGSGQYKLSLATLTGTWSGAQTSTSSSGLLTVGAYDRYVPSFMGFTTGNGGGHFYAGPWAYWHTDSFAPTDLPDDFDALPYTAGANTGDGSPTWTNVDDIPFSDGSEIGIVDPGSDTDYHGKATTGPHQGPSGDSNFNGTILGAQIVFRGYRTNGSGKTFRLNFGNDVDGVSKTGAGGFNIGTSAETLIGWGTVADDNELKLSNTPNGYRAASASDGAIPSSSQYAQHGFFRSSGSGQDLYCTDMFMEILHEPSAGTTHETALSLGASLDQSEARTATFGGAVTLPLQFTQSQSITGTFEGAVNLAAGVSQAQTAQAIVNVATALAVQTGAQNAANLSFDDSITLGAQLAGVHAANAVFDGSISVGLSAAQATAAQGIFNKSVQLAAQFDDLNAGSAEFHAAIALSAELAATNQRDAILAGALTLAASLLQQQNADISFDAAMALSVGLAATKAGSADYQSAASLGAGFTHSANSQADFGASVSLGAQLADQAQVDRTTAAALILSAVLSDTYDADTALEVAVALASSLSASSTAALTAQGSISLGMVGDVANQPSADVSGALNLGASLDQSQSRIATLASALSLGATLDLTQDQLSAISAALSLGSQFDQSQDRTADLAAALSLGAALGDSDAANAVFSAAATLSAALGQSQARTGTLAAALLLGADLASNYAAETQAALEASMTLAVELAKVDTGNADFESVLALAADLAQTHQGAAIVERSLSLGAQLTDAGSATVSIERAMSLGMRADLAGQGNAVYDAAIALAAGLDDAQDPVAAYLAALTLLAQQQVTNTATVEGSPEIEAALSLNVELAIQALAGRETSGDLILDMQAGIAGLAEAIFENSVALGHIASVSSAAGLITDAAAVFALQLEQQAYLSIGVPIGRRTTTFTQAAHTTKSTPIHTTAATQQSNTEKAKNVQTTPDASQSERTVH